MSQDVLLCSRSAEVVGSCRVLETYAKHGAGA